MNISIDRGVCCDLNQTIAREWLLTNGRGSYAAGTVAGVLTRRQHGLLVALSPATQRPQLLLAKIDEEIVFDQRTYYLGTNEYRDGALHPAGFVHLEGFRLDAGIPTFTYRLGGADGFLLEKRIWMEYGRDTTYVQYQARRISTGRDTQRFTRGNNSSKIDPYRPASLSEPSQLSLTLLPFAAYRPYNELQSGNNTTHYHVQLHQPVSQSTLDQPAEVHLPRGVAGCTIQATEQAHPYHIFAVGRPEDQVTYIPTGVWYWKFLHRHDPPAHDPAIDDLYLPAVIRTTLDTSRGSTLTIIVSAEPLSSLLLYEEQIARSAKDCSERQHQMLKAALEQYRHIYYTRPSQPLHVLPLTTDADPYSGGEDYLRHLLLASDHFLASYKQVKTPQQHYSSPLAYPRSSVEAGLFTSSERLSVLLADYYSLESRTRDILIALPGLTLSTKRYDDAQSLLRQLARAIIGGILPDRLPLPGHALLDSDYQSADTTLWYFYALDYYLRATHDYAFLEEIFQQLKDCINRYIQGTYQGIQMDPDDGLLLASKAGKALTWMNMYSYGTPVTPRAGKPVEVNALWYHALSLMHEWSEQLNQMGHFGHNPLYYHALLTRCAQSFQRRFWYAPGGYLYDVVDGPQGNDPSIRPNQLFALSLRYPVLDSSYWQRVVEVVARHLLTPFGLRTLSPEDANYSPHRANEHKQIEQGQETRLHQGCVWPWLIGPYIDAILKVPTTGQDRDLCQEYLWRKGLQLLEPFGQRFHEGLLGTCEGVLEPEPPYRPVQGGQAVASALSIAELLRCYQLLAQIRASTPQQALSY